MRTASRAQRAEALRLVAVFGGEPDVAGVLRDILLPMEVRVPVGAVVVNVSQGLWRGESQQATQSFLTDVVPALTNTCSAGAGGSGTSGPMGLASMGRTSCASCLELLAAAMGDAERARKDSSSWAVTRPAELHVDLAAFLRGDMPGLPCRVSSMKATEGMNPNMGLEKSLVVQRLGHECGTQVTARVLWKAGTGKTRVARIGVRMTMALSAGWQRHANQGRLFTYRDRQRRLIGSGGGSCSAPSLKPALVPQCKWSANGHMTRPGFIGGVACLGCSCRLSAFPLVGLAPTLYRVLQVCVFCGFVEELLRERCQASRSHMCLILLFQIESFRLVSPSNTSARPRTLPSCNLTCISSSAIDLVFIVGLASDVKPTVDRLNHRRDESVCLLLNVTILRRTSVCSRHSMLGRPSIGSMMFSAT